MSQGELNELAENYMQIWQAGHEDLLDRYASNDIEVSYTHFDKIYRGIEEYKDMLRMTHHYFPDLSITIYEVIPAQYQTTIEWAYYGTHENGNLFGIEASNREVQVKGLTILSIRNGVITHEKGIVDNLQLLRQLGVFE